MDTKTLLQNGTNEFEVLKFGLDGKLYGIKVASVNEIMHYQTVTPVPNAHSSIEGVFMPRDVMIAVIDLRGYLRRGQSKPDGQFIITKFNKLNIAFHVDSVKGIHRVSWNDIIKPDSTVSATEEGVSTGVIKKDGELIIVLDFDKIVTDINPETVLRTPKIKTLDERSRSDVSILLAEDSVSVSRLIVDCLKKAGYNNITHTTNGQEAWEIIEKYKALGSLNREVQLVITDIEMPRMDGHRLTRLIKEDPASSKIPVVIFSPFINEEMRRKGEAFGVNAQVNKSEIGNLVKIVDDLLR